MQKSEKLIKKKNISSAKIKQKVAKTFPLFDKNKFILIYFKASH